MSKHSTPFADLASSLDRLAQELFGASDLEGTSPEYFQSRMHSFLTLLADVVKAARVTVEPAMADEAYRANSAPGEAA